MIGPCFLIVLRAVVVVTVQACAVRPGPDTPVTRAPRAIASGSWELTDSSLVGTGRIPGVRRPTLAFEHGRLAAFGGCNRLLAAGHTLDGRLIVEGATETRRPCAEPLGGFEDRYFKLLQASPSIYMEGNTLILAGTDHNARFRRIAPPAVRPAP